jgi:hypothetical protein
VGPNIILKIFLSKIISFWIIASLSTHVSEPYITTGLITVLYILSLNRLVNNLLFRNFWFSEYALLPSSILSLISSSMVLSFRLLLVIRNLIEIVYLAGSL